MTVEDLIRELAKYPPGTEVKLYSDYYDTEAAIRSVEFEDARPAHRAGGVLWDEHPAQVIIR